MKKKIKRICGVLLTVLLIFGMVQYAGYRLKPKSLENTYCQIQAFHMLPDNSVDVMVYGSSHCWNGFDVNVLTQQYGISAYNYSCMWQHMNTTRLFLKDSLKYLYLLEYHLQFVFQNLIHTNLYLNLLHYISQYLKTNKNYKIYHTIDDYFVKSFINLAFFFASTNGYWCLNCK